MCVRVCARIRRGGEKNASWPLSNRSLLSSSRVYTSHLRSSWKCRVWFWGSLGGCQDSVFPANSQMTLILPAAVLVTEAASSGNLSFIPLYTLVHEYLRVSWALSGLSCIAQDLSWQCTNALGCDAQTQWRPCTGLVAPVTCGILVPRPGMEPTSSAL